LERAVQTRLNAGNVHFFGIGATRIIVQDAQQKLIRINKGATAFTDVKKHKSFIPNRKNF
jgi:DNA-binding MurR/RpiR family transcriptional regulator